MTQQVQQAPLLSPEHGTAHETLLSILRDIPAVGLDQLEGAALLDRVDTKYLLSEEAALALLGALASDYRVLELNGLKLHPYRTLYFDTDDLALYRAHHDGIAARQKVRSRQYMQSGLAFFEVKRKLGRNRTVKDRLCTSGLVTAVDGEEQKFLAQHPQTPASLSPKVLNEFSRVTLVNHDRAERITFDFGLRYAFKDRRAGLPGLVIVELKQSRPDRFSRLIREMRDRGVPGRAISKYCLGVALLLPEVKHNGFKPLLLAIEKLTRGCSDV